MKIAVTSTGKTLDSQVDQRFGRTAHFIIIDTETMDFSVIENESVAAAGGVGISSAKVDRNPDDPEADKKFVLVKCAYKLLAEDEPSEMLLEEIKSWSDVPEDSKYKLDSLWGHFLWWREKFFG